MIRPIVFGKFCLLERLSVGGMAEIYRANLLNSPSFNRFLVVKRVLPSLAEDREFITMFIDEAKISVEFNHPNICRVYELGRLNDTHYMVMEYIPGRDLLSILRHYRRQKKIMSVSQACFIVMQVANGLHHAHAAVDSRGEPLGIIHRDVSPQNILVSYEGLVKLIDFGVAKAATKNSKTQAGVLKGKFGYMSPEQADGKATLDHRSDIFGLGTVLWELLTGRRLFHADNEYETLEKVRNANVLPPSTFNHLVPEMVDNIVMRALQPDRNYRYQYASEMAQELWGFINSCNPPYTQGHLQQWMCSAFADALEEEWEWVDLSQKFKTVEDVRKHNTVSLVEEEFSTGQDTQQTIDNFGNVVSEISEDEDFKGERTHVFSSNEYSDEGDASEGLPQNAGKGKEHVPANAPHNITQAEMATFNPAEHRRQQAAQQNPRPRQGGGSIALVAVLFVALVGLGVAAFVLLTEDDPAGEEEVEAAPVSQLKISVGTTAEPLEQPQLVKVELLKDGEVVASAEGASASFEDVAQGAYQLRAHHPGYVSVIANVELTEETIEHVVAFDQRQDAVATITVSPPDLEILVDGQKIESPEAAERLISMKIGVSHNVQFQRPGYVPHEETVLIGVTETTLSEDGVRMHNNAVEVSLEKGVGSLQLTAEPARATITVRGDGGFEQAFESSPAAIAELDASQTYTVTVECSGYETWSEQLTPERFDAAGEARAISLSVSLERP